MKRRDPLVFSILGIELPAGRVDAAWLQRDAERPVLVPLSTLLYGEKGTKWVLEY